MEKYVKEETINVNQEPAMKLEYINVEHESVDGNPDHVKVYRERVLYDKKAYWIGRRLQDIVFSAIALMVLWPLMLIIAILIFIIPTLLSFLLGIVNSIWGNIGNDLCGIIF